MSRFQDGNEKDTYMKITFLGTGAADWDINSHKSIEGFRRNSSVLIDDILLIDPGPDVPDALESFDKSIDGIRYIINTHNHPDHYNENTVLGLKNAVFHPLKNGDILTVGRYTITAFAANHSTCREAVHFIISDSEKKLFYGLDGAWLMYDEVAAIKSSGIDFAVFDATIGDHPGDYRIFEHNNLNMVLEMKLSLEPYIKRFCISHMARTLHKPHVELTRDMEKYGIETAFDGYETDI